VAVAVVEERPLVASGTHPCCVPFFLLFLFLPMHKKKTRILERIYVLRSWIPQPAA